MSTKRTEPAEQQPATSASNQMIEQINIALEQKVRISQLVVEACNRELTSRKESIYIN